MVVVGSGGGGGGWERLVDCDIVGVDNLNLYVI